CIDHMFEFTGEHVLVLRRRVAATRHVLPHEHAESIRVVVPPRRFDLYVLANEVEAETLRRFNVRRQSLIGRRGVEAVRPPSLIEQSILKHWLSVEKKAIHTGKKPLPENCG